MIERPFKTKVVDVGRSVECSQVTFQHKIENFDFTAATQSKRWIGQHETMLTGLVLRMVVEVWLCVHAVS